MLNGGERKEKDPIPQALSMWPGLECRNVLEGFKQCHLKAHYIIEKSKKEKENFTGSCVAQSCPKHLYTFCNYRSLSHSVTVPPQDTKQTPLLFCSSRSEGQQTNRQVSVDFPLKNQLHVRQGEEKPSRDVCLYHLHVDKIKCLPRCGYTFLLCSTRPSQWAGAYWVGQQSNGDSYQWQGKRQSYQW